MTLGEKIVKLRKENNYTQEQLAEILDVSRQSISKWESNIVYPETSKLIHMSKLFNCTTDYLLLDEIETIENKEKNNSDNKSGSIKKIFIESPLTKNLVFCSKVTVSSVLFPTKKQPKYLLLGVDKVTAFGEHTTQLGWYKTEEDIQKEISEITEAISKGENSYTLKYDVDVNSFGNLKDVKLEKSGDSNVKKKFITIIAVIFLLIFIGTIYGKWNDLFYEFGRNIYRLLH